MPNALPLSLNRRGCATLTSTVAEQLERHAVMSIETTIPADMTIEQWRALRLTRPRSKRRRLLDGLQARRTLKARGPFALGSV